MNLSRSDIQGLYERYAHIVHRRCLSILRDEEEAYDALQEVFVRLIEHADQFRGEASPLTWLYRTSTNLCLNRIRDKRSRARKLAAPDPAVSALPGMGVADRGTPETRHLAATLLDETDECTRAIVVYYFLDEMTLQEVADMVGVSVPTIRKRIRRFQRIAGKRLGRAALTACLLSLVAGGFVLGRNS